MNNQNRINRDIPVIGYQQFITRFFYPNIFKSGLFQITPLKTILFKTIPLKTTPFKTTPFKATPLKTKPRTLCYVIAGFLAAGSLATTSSKAYAVNDFAKSDFAKNAIKKSYIETANSGNPASWRSKEFLAQWGLAAIHADEAYAKGYTGKGVKLGIFDQVVYANHPEFVGKNKVINIYTSGVREYTDPYIPVKKGDPFAYGGKPSVQKGNVLGSHGTHVAGIAAGSRDGGIMHGVAYNAQIISADNGDPGPEDGIILGNDGGVYQAGWNALVESGARIINNSWGIGIVDKFYHPKNNPNGPHFTLEYAQQQFNEIKPILGTKPGGAYQGAIDAARSGALVIFSAGNSYNYNEPDAITGLPWFVPDITSNWLTVASLQQDANSSNQLPYTISVFSSRCGFSASFCVSAPGSLVYSSVIGGTSVDTPTIDYAFKSGTSMASPHVSGSAAVLMERFPYMDGAQISSVLRTTATDMGKPGIDEIYGWGMINLGKAINGPAMFYTAEDIPAEFRVPDPAAYGDGQFIADLPGVGAVIDKGKPAERVCEGSQCEFDIWSNDIKGHGGVTKQGRGTLILVGQNTYSGPTLVKQGVLGMAGSLTSAVTVQNSGTFGGNGTISSLDVQHGGAVSPGFSTIGQFDVARSVLFESDSRYFVDVTAGGSSDSIHAADKAQLNGGKVDVAVADNLLAYDKVNSLTDQQYNILTAEKGISGRFAETGSEHLFLDSHLSYQPQRVHLSLSRNQTAFADVALTQHERSVAEAADSLGVGNPLYESILTATSAEQVRHAFHQLDGQIHADIASALVNESRYLRDTVNTRLNQPNARLRPISSAAYAENSQGETGSWVNLLGAWNRSSGTANASGYHSSTYGVLLGFDGLLDEHSRLGIATGYTRTALDGKEHADADSNNYHVALYGDRQFGDLSLRTGGGYTWHRIDTDRTVNYGYQYAREEAKYNGRSAQLFVEAAYNISTAPVDLEPFVSLAYVGFSSDGINEKRGAAALHADKQHTEATFSTLGLRANHDWQMSSDSIVTLHGELGWQHQYGDRERAVSLAFRGSDKAFVTHSVPVSQDSLILKTKAEITAGKNAALTLGYSGELFSNHQDNSVNAGFIWRF
ncbi:MAG: autotransporter domain-containing protein [Enterobacteriaceae bacterium]|nr:autotransporter domain-containing protein [Enterobacteriaceae bacterium]